MTNLIKKGNTEPSSVIIPITKRVHVEVSSTPDNKKLIINKVKPIIAGGQAIGFNMEVASLENGYWTITDDRIFRHLIIYRARQIAIAIHKQFFN